MDQRQRPNDKVELAPTSRSTCRLCNNKIQKDTMRVAVHQLHGIYWNCKYYHKSCVRSKQGSEIMKHARFNKAHSGQKRKSGAISALKQVEIAATAVQQKKRRTQDVINSRGDLRESLRKARLSIAKHWCKPAYIVFHDTALDALVEQMPCNETELRNVHGFGPQKTSSLGPFLLPIIKVYKQKLSKSAKTTCAKQLPSSPSSVSKLSSVNRYQHDEDEEVVFESELSIDERIQRTIKEAAERGHIMEMEL